MRRLKLWLPIAALGALGAAGAAIAIAHQHTDPVTATVNATRQALREQTCTGDDGGYRRAREAYTGTSTGDARLAGDAGVVLRSLTNTTTGAGTFNGGLVVRDVTTHEVKARAGLAGAITGSGALHGLALGRARDSGTLLGGRVVGVVQGTVGSGTIVLHLGGTGDNATPAFVQRGHCDSSGLRAKPHSRRGAKPRRR